MLQVLRQSSSSEMLSSGGYSRYASWLTAACLVLVQATGCSAQHARTAQPSTASPSVSTSSAQPQQLDPASFNGPIIESCPPSGTETNISKLNIDTGQLAPIATFPFEGCFTYGQFGAQLERLRFSPDFLKAALPQKSANADLEYYDVAEKKTVDVTRIVAPPATGDFGAVKDPTFSAPQFDDQGLFVFYDPVAGLYSFFDTASQKVVRTSKTYQPKFFQWVSVSPDVLADGVFPDNASADVRTCSALWAVDATQYLRKDQENLDEFLQLAPLGEGVPNCSPIQPGKHLTPPTSDLYGAAADPSGSTVLFLVFSRTTRSALDLYRVDARNPGTPTPIRVQGGILDKAGTSGDGSKVLIVGW